MATYITPAWTNGASPAINAANLLAMGYALEETQHPYAPCTTAAGTAAKTATISNISNPNFSAFLGLHVIVRFQYANTASNPTLNINNTGDLPIYNYGSVRLDTWKDGQFFTLVYRSSAWYVAGTCDTGAYSKVATGWYTGTGVYGASNQNTILIGFEPKFVFIKKPGSAGPNGKGGGMIALFCQSGADVTAQGTTTTGFDGTAKDSVTTDLLFERGHLTGSGNTTLGWYNSNSATDQFNTSGTTYYWVAIG